MQQAATMQVTSTASLPAVQRFSYWADVVAQTFVPLECDTPARRSFSGSIRHRKIGRIGIADVRASAQRVQRTRAKIARAPSDDLIVVIHAAGRCHVGQGDHDAFLNPCDGAVVSARETYFFDFPDAFHQLVLKMPRTLLRPTTARERSHTFRLATGPAGILRHLALATLEGPATLSEMEEAGIERALSELLGTAAMPQMLRTPDQDPAQRRHGDALRIIRCHLAEPDLTPSRIAAHVGLSVRSLSRVFALRGETVERTIWSLRLAAARDDLADSRQRGRSITDIAFSWGFNDAAHFSRSFVQAYGLTPTQFRAKAGGVT